MKRQSSDQEAEPDSKRSYPQKSRPERSRKTTVIIVAIMALCLSFAQTAMAATGTVNYNAVYQQLEGFGGAAVYDVQSISMNIPSSPRIGAKKLNSLFTLCADN